VGAEQSAPLSAFSAAQIVKHYAVRAGLDPAAYSGHSLRAGFLTSAAEAGASVFKMMEMSRHKSVDVLRSYVRRADLFKEHAGPRSYDETDAAHRYSQCTIVTNAARPLGNTFQMRSPRPISSQRSGLGGDVIGGS
jgi:site-specific recombinase XerD